MATKNFIRIALLLFILGASSHASAAQFARTQLLMGDIPVSITVKTSNSKKDKAFLAMEEAYSTARLIEWEVSEFNPLSQTSLLNRNAGIAPVSIGKNLFEILKTARQVSVLTDGIFDITFASKDRSISYHDVEIGEQSFLKKKGTVIKVSGVAKGYIVDQMALALKKAGFKKFLINAGGEIMARGQWSVAIRDPKNPDGEPILHLNVRNRAISTSGLYERGNHLFDAKTRKPVERGGSVTVIANNSSTADAWDTAAFLMGKEKLETIRYKLRDVEFIFIQNGQIN